MHNFMRVCTSSGLYVSVYVHANIKFEALFISIRSPTERMYTALRPSTNPLSSSMFRGVDSACNEKIKLGISVINYPLDS